MSVPALAPTSPPDTGASRYSQPSASILAPMTIEAVGEALLFASRAGADPARVRQALMGGFASSKILEVHGERMVKRTFDPGFRIALHQKDLNIALTAARQMGLSLPNTATCQDCSTPAPPTAAAAGTIRRSSRRSRPWQISRSVNPPDRVSNGATTLDPPPSRGGWSMRRSGKPADAVPAHCRTSGRGGA